MFSALKSLRQDRSYYFVKGAFFRFFIPAIISSFWLAIAGVVDSIFVGNEIGTAGLAAIGLGQPVYLFYNILSYGFSIGGSIHYAAKLAEGREEEGNRIFMTVLRLLICTYIVTAALGIILLPQLMVMLGADPGDTVTRTYIRTQLIFVPIMFCQGPFFYFVNADNGPKLAATALSLSGLLDTIFSYIFISVLHLGVAGSVYSTVVGALLMLTMTGSHIIRKKGALRFSHMPFDLSVIANSARTGFATALHYLYEFITIIAVNRLLMYISGSVAVAAFDVVYNISVLCVAITDGSSIATEPMLSSYRSERNLNNIRITLYLELLWAGILSAIFASLCFIFAPSASVLFGMKEGTSLLYTSAGIRIFSFSIIPAMFNVVFSGYYQSILHEEMAYLITFLRSFAFFLVALLLCSRQGMNYFWYIFLVSEFLTTLVWIPFARKKGGITRLNDVDVSHAKSIIIDSSSQDISEVISSMQEFYGESIHDKRLVMYIGLVIEEVCCLIIDRFRDKMGEIYIQVTAVTNEDEEGCTLYLRDNALEFNPMGTDTDTIDLKAGEQLDLMGMRIVQKRAKEFYYRRYSGFNTLVIRL